MAPAHELFGDALGSASAATAQGRIFITKDKDLHRCSEALAWTAAWSRRRGWGGMLKTRTEFKEQARNAFDSG